MCNGSYEETIMSLCLEAILVGLNKNRCTHISFKRKSLAEKLVISSVQKCRNAVLTKGSGHWILMWLYEKKSRHWIDGIATRKT